MSILIDLLGALMIATLLLLMMITFQLQLRDTADRTIFAAQMMTHVQTSCKELNSLIAMASINIAYSPSNTNDPAKLAVTNAKKDRLEFQTWWDFSDSIMTAQANTVTIEIGPSSPVGKQLNITQAANPIYEFRPILWIDDIQFKYFNINGDSLTYASLIGAQDIQNKNAITSIETMLTFKRIPPRVTDVKPLTVRVQMRCYLMNRHLKIGQS